jgi:hypothetical protein
MANGEAGPFPVSRPCLALELQHRSSRLRTLYANVHATRERGRAGRQAGIGAFQLAYPLEDDAATEQKSKPAHSLDEKRHPAGARLDSFDPRTGKIRRTIRMMTHGTEL